jgi:hypothetical protein
MTQHTQGTIPSFLLFYTSPCDIHVYYVSIPLRKVNGLGSFYNSKGFVLNVNQTSLLKEKKTKQNWRVLKKKKINLSVLCQVPKYSANFSWGKEA